MPDDNPLVGLHHFAEEEGHGRLGEQREEDSSRMQWAKALHVMSSDVDARWATWGDGGCPI